jgi:hypothetical protein
MAGKITFLAVVKILLENNHKFVTEIADKWDNLTVLRCVAAKGYPHATPYIQKGDSTDQALMTEDRNNCDGQVLLYYDTGSQRVIGATKNIYDMIAGHKNKVLEKALTL